MGGGELQATASTAVPTKVAAKARSVEVRVTR
jgi:hypothetical protein